MQHKYFHYTPDNHSQQTAMEQNSMIVTAALNNSIIKLARIPGEVKVLSMITLGPSWLVATTDTR